MVIIKNETIRVFNKKKIDIKWAIRFDVLHSHIAYEIFNNTHDAVAGHCKLVCHVNGGKIGATRPANLYGGKVVTIDNLD